MMNYNTEIRKAFENAVDNYLQTCDAENVIPEKPFKGSFNIRIGEELHEEATLAALDQNMKLNEFVRAAINQEVERFRKNTEQTKKHKIEMTKASENSDSLPKRATSNSL